MPLSSQPIGLGGFIPNVPSVGRDPITGRWVKLSDEIVLMYKTVAAEALNDFINNIATDSLREVPKEDEELADSAKYPANDPGSRAHADWLWGDISYNTPYAHVQHEGMMIYVRHHPVIHMRGGGFFTDVLREEETTIEWKVENYTTPGTKSHFLSDPMKSHIPLMEDYVGARIKAVFG